MAAPSVDDWDDRGGGGTRVHAIHFFLIYLFNIFQQSEHTINS